MKGKKIGILTQPLKQNYGGLLQAYALQEVIKRMDMKPYVLDIHPFKKANKIRKLASVLKTFINRFFFNKKVNYNYLFVDDDIVNKEINVFKSDYINPKSPILSSMKSFNEYLSHHNFDTYIVGSDQVWRPKYSPHLPLYFLSFLEENKKVRKISYAASFGVDSWEFSEIETTMARRLIKDFNRISVREESGVKLCSYYLGREAEHVLDPTMLLKKEDYLLLIRDFEDDVVRKDVFVYILDDNYNKSRLVKQVCSSLNMDSYCLSPNKIKYKTNNFFSINMYQKKSVLSWIKSISTAKFVVTDSFHGCVFSIIFNKPFLAIGNTNRGFTRFDSLLKMFNLRNRLDLSFVDKSIDWVSVNNILREQRSSSLAFLQNNI